MQVFSPSNAVLLLQLLSTPPHAPIRIEQSPANISKQWLDLATVTGSYVQPGSCGLKESTVQWMRLKSAPLSTPYGYNFSCSNPGIQATEASQQNNKQHNHQLLLLTSLLCCCSCLCLAFCCPLLKHHSCNRWLSRGLHLWHSPHRPCCCWHERLLVLR